MNFQNQVSRCQLLNMANVIVHYLDSLCGAGTAGLSPTSRRAAPSPTGLGRHWILPSSAGKQ
ncbi:hypothetical protein EI555_009111 [Monodon monoceros]|uniref:Uncharacterized protein n=1 Tax=Monodon monoceros TaxID=40151 RepID=A0A4U1FRL0_MONMO|nr:hypothetical protein EI555_009111 [Monodon monoceros]